MNRVLTLLAVPTLLLFAGTPALSDQAKPKLSNTFDRCMNASQGVTVEMHDCISAEQERQDARLNRTYQALLARLSNDQKLRLRQVERRWLKTTKEHCDHAGDDNEGGTLQTIEIADCYMTETAKRADVLAQYKP